MKYKLILATLTFTLICSSCHSSSPASVEEVADRPPLLITHHQKSATTSTGGVGHNLKFINPTNHTYQQVAFVLIPYDRFGRRQSSDIDNVDEVQISLPDSVGPGAALSESWPDIWFSHQITCVELDRLRVVHADGSARVFVKADVDMMLAPGVDNNCRQ